MPTTIQGEEYLNTAEAMSYLGVTRPTLDAMVRDGRLKRYKQGFRKSHYYKRADLERLLELREVDDDEE